MSSSSAPSVLLKKQMKDNLRSELNNSSPRQSNRSWFDILEDADEEELYTDEHFNRITTPDVTPQPSPIFTSCASANNSDDEATDEYMEEESSSESGSPMLTPSSLGNSIGPHYLRNKWTIYYDQGVKQGANPLDYEQSIKSVGSFDTVEDFWRYWNNINLPYNKLPSYFNLRLFKNDIKPLYEDPNNINGGRWVIQTHHKESRKDTWSEIVLAIIGEKHFSDKYQVSGVVLSSRKTYDAIQIWNGCMLDRQHIQLVMKKIRKILRSMDTDNTTTIEYQANRGVKKYNERENAKKSILKALQGNFTSFSPPPSPSLNSPSFSPSIPKLLSPLTNPANMMTALDLPPLSLEEVESSILNGTQEQDTPKQNTLYSAGHSIGRVSSGFVVGRGFHLNSRSRSTQQEPSKRNFDEISSSKEDEKQEVSIKPSTTSKPKHENSATSKHPLTPKHNSTAPKPNNSSQPKTEVGGMQNADVLKLISLFVMAVIWQFMNTTK